MSPDTNNPYANLKNWRALAEAATKGTWTWSKHPTPGHISAFVIDEAGTTRVPIADVYSEEDARYLFALQPALLIGLLDKIEADQESKLQLFKEFLEVISAFEKLINTLGAEVSALRSLLGLSPCHVLVPTDLFNWLEGLLSLDAVKGESSR